MSRPAPATRLRKSPALSRPPGAGPRPSSSPSAGPTNLPWRLNFPCMIPVRTDCDLRAEQLLDGALHIHLRGGQRHFEDNDGRGLTGDRRLLGNQRATDDVGDLLHPSTSCSRSIAARVAMMRCVFITSRAVRRPLATTVTPARLRADSAELLVRLHVDHQRAARAAQAPQQFRRGLGLDFRHAQRVDDRHGAVTKLRRQRRAQRATFDLLRQLERVAARLRPEDRAALAPERRARRSRPAAGPCPSACRASCRCR